MRTSLISWTGSRTRSLGASTLGGAATLALVAGGAAAVPAVTATDARAAAVTISQGHVDAIGARIVGGRLRFLLKDDSGSRLRWRDPHSVVMRVGANARYRLPSSSALSFVGRPGQSVWLIPQTQKRGVIWAGWNTEEIRSNQIRGQVGWTLDRVSGPGRVTIYQTGSFGKPSVLFNSAKRTPQRRSIPTGVHAHANWTFTAKGTYRMTFTLSATLASGKRSSQAKTLTIRVG